MRRFAFPIALLLTARVVFAPLEARADANSSAAETESTGYSATSTTVLAGVTVVVAIVVLVVVLTQKDRFPRAPAPTADVPSAAERLGVGLVEQGLCGGAGALPVLLAGLVESPSAMDTFTLEATLGAGPHLDAVGRAAGLSAAEVGVAWAQTVGAPAATRDDAFAAVVRFVVRIGPRLAPDQADAAALIEALAEEQARPDFPARAPAHAEVAEWTGLTTAEVAPVVARVLADSGRAPSSRAWRRAHAVELADALGAGLGAASPERVFARGQALLARGQALGVPVDEAALAGL